MAIEDEDYDCYDEGDYYEGNLDSDCDSGDVVAAVVDGEDEGANIRGFRNLDYDVFS